MLERAAAGAPRTVVIQAAPANRSAVVLILVGVVLAGVAGAVVLLRSGAGTTSPARATPIVVASMPGDEAQPVVPFKAVAAEVAAPDPPKAELEGTERGETSIGGHFWLTTYANVGTVPIGRPSVTVSLFDDGGKRVGEEHGYAEVPVLAPGDRVPVLVLASKPPKYARADVSVDPQPQGYESPALPLTVREMTVQSGSFRQVEAIGTVVNEGDVPVDFAQVVVTGRDDKGALVSYAHGYTTVTALAPGADSGFNISMGTWELRKATSYEAVAFASRAR
ncbi:MAG TPA: FxLYD domain-containing protein [Nannocystaceae bacterium]|nr:FxLYD domain-containing protein [Nannocystaceae bacterium]